VLTTQHCRRVDHVITVDSFVDRTEEAVGSRPRPAVGARFECVVDVVGRRVLISVSAPATDVTVIASSAVTSLWSSVLLVPVIFIVSDVITVD